MYICVHVTVGGCLLLFLPCLQSKYQYVPAEEALQAVDLSGSWDSLP